MGVILLEIFFFNFFIFADLSWEGGVTLLQIDIKLPRTYKKIHCKGESYRLRGKRDILVKSDRQTDRNPIIY